MGIDPDVEVVLVVMQAEIDELKAAILADSGVVPDTMASKYPGGRTVVYTKTSDVG